MSSDEWSGLRLIVFSAVGSLPLHIAAVLVFAAGPAALPAEATGLVSSAILYGLFAAVLLQAFGTARRLLTVRLWLLVAAEVGILILLPILPLGPGLVAWFLVGAISGVFMFKGMVAAAAAQQKYLGFLTRLAVAMALAGLIALGVSALGEARSYTTVCALYAAVLVLIYAVTRPDREETLSAAAPARASAPAPAILLALAPLVIFYVGGLMVGSHLPLFVRLYGPIGADPMGVFGLAKIVGALVLTGTLLVWRRDSLARLLLSSGLLVVAAALLGFTTVLPILAVAITFELALNIAGAAFMAEVARSGPTDAHRFIPAAGLAGIAAGPSVGAYVAAVMSPAALLGMAIGAIVASLALYLNRRRMVLPIVVLAAMSAYTLGTR